MATPQDDIASLSLEDLSNIRVTSVSRRSESAFDAAASIFVISADSIKRAGVSTLPEALRLAPNLQVARVDARNYAVTARGFNSAFDISLVSADKAGLRLSSQLLTLAATVIREKR